MGVYGFAHYTSAKVKKDPTHLGELPLVQVHTNSIHLTDRCVKVCLEVSVRAEGFGDVTDFSVLCVQLDRLEVLDVVPLEEHVSDGGGLFVDLERMAGKNNSLGDDPCWIRR